MDTIDQKEKAALKDSITVNLMPSLINHAVNVKCIDSMIDTMETTIVELMRIITELKPKDDSNEKTMEVDSCEHMIDILKKMKETFKLQDESLQITNENMLKQVEQCFAMLGVKLGINEQLFHGKKTDLEGKNSDSNTEENSTRKTDTVDITTNNGRHIEEVVNITTSSLQTLDNDLQEQAAITSQTMQDLLAENAKQRECIKRLHTELNRLSPGLKSNKRQTYSVQLFCQRKGGMIDSVRKELTSIMQGYLSVRFEQREQICDINPNKTLLVFCINASRLGTEAANAIEGIKSPENTLLLIFHHKNAHALNNMQESEKCLTAQPFRALGGIFDFAFHSNKGIYECKMNENATSAVVSFIRCNEIN